MKPSFLRRMLAAAALAVSSPFALAHDTWFEPLASPPGETLFAFGTGNRFPVTDLAVDAKYFVKDGCRAGDGSAVALATLRYADNASILRASGSAGAGSLTCFVELAPFEFDVPLDKIDIYFKEIRPPAAIVAKWADMHARGLPFHERYTKNARIDLGAVSSPQTTGMVMDVLRTAPQGPLAVGNDVVFQLLRDGKPLADQPLELINERSPIGLWYRTDADGRIRAKMPLPGRWLLRGTDLRISDSKPDQFESQFITYAFDVAR